VTNDGQAPQVATEDGDKAEFDLEAELAKLTPEEADMFMRALRLAMRKRRVLLIGYLATVISLVLGTVWALYIYGKTRGSGEFMVWVFLVPLFVAAICLMSFGRISRSLKK